MAKTDRSVILSNDQDFGQIADPNKLETMITHAYDKIDENDDELINYKNLLSGTSGASNIGITAINGLTATTAQQALEGLKSQINDVVLGQIPDGSITKEKLTFEPILKSGDTMTGLLTLAESIGIALGAGGRIRDYAGLRTALNAESDRFDVISEDGQRYLVRIMNGDLLVYNSDGTLNISLNDLKSDVSNGKSTSGALATAITGKGGTLVDADADGYHTFQELTDGVNSIVTTPIKSIQRGFTAIASGSLSATVNISSVDVNNAILLVEESYSDGDTNTYARNSLILGTFVSATQIKLERADSVGNVNVSWQVIEFDSNAIQSLQKGLATTPDNSKVADVTISSVDTTKTLLFCSYLFSGALKIDKAKITSRFLSSTSLRFERNEVGASGEYNTIQWFAVELK